MAPVSIFITLQQTVFTKYKKILKDNNSQLELDHWKKEGQSIFKP